MRKLLYPLILASLLGVTAQVSAGPWFGNWWGPDGYWYWQYTTVSVTVPTGYWYGSYPYYYGGYNWNAYHGWYNPIIAPGISPYAARYNLTVGRPYWWWGFTDYYTYTFSGYVPRHAYHWSYYCDPPDGKAGVLDVLSMADESLGAIPFDPSIMSEVSLGDHYWTFNGGNPVNEDPINAGDITSGTFSPNEWVLASESAITAYLLDTGVATPEDIAEVLAQPLIQDLIANNAGGTGNGVIGLSCALCDIPEPNSISLLIMGGAALMLWRRLAHSRSNC